MKGTYEEVKVQEVYGRYLPPVILHPLLTELSPVGALRVIGFSVENRPIHSIRIGAGSTRVLMWSQMHGNESTTTKALLDLVRVLTNKGVEGQGSLELLIIPMLNPDGAAAYTRMNANNVDLNRDAVDLSQPESRVLREVFESFQPHFCFNLHDQRTLFGVGAPPKPATLSLLAPSADPDRRFPANRDQAARLAAYLADSLEQIIGVGRYDDTFNLNCVGDYFQAQGVPTLLFEAGHYPGDYERETSRRFVFEALTSALQAIASGAFKDYSLTRYREIPENRKCFVDILIRNVHFLDGIYPKGHAFGIRYEEHLAEGRVGFNPQLVNTGDLEHLYGHITWDLSIPAERKKLEENRSVKAVLNAASGESF